MQFQLENHSLAIVLFPLGHFFSSVIETFHVSIEFRFLRQSVFIFYQREVETTHGGGSGGGGEDS